MHDPIVFRYQTGKARLVAAGGLLVAMFGLLIFVQDDPGAKLFGLIWIGAMLAVSLILLDRARSKKPIIVIDEKGIYDRRIGAFVIPWSDIAAVSALEAEHITFAAIDLKPDAESYRHLGALHRLMRGPNRMLRFPALSIAMHTLDGTTHDLLNAVSNFRPGLVRRDQSDVA